MFKSSEAIAENLCGGKNPREVAFHFGDLVELMEKFGFRYIGNDDDDKTINFADEKCRFYIYPKHYYPQMDMLRIYNAQLV